MKLVAEIAVRFDLTTDVAITFGESLEVSLDCPVCHRCWRTVVFYEGQPQGKCTPTGHAFPGRIIEKKSSQLGRTASVVYRLAYSYEPFSDAKYPKRKPSGQPTWGRVKFNVRCSKCGQVTEASTQNNLVRPWDCRCSCGRILYTEKEEQPVLSSAVG